MSNEPINQFPMKWHNFLIYFALWANAVLMVLTAIASFTGSQYDSPELIYAQIPGLKSVDICYSILCIGIAVFSIYTRYQLARFRKGAPGKFMLLQVLSAALGIGYPVALSVCSKIPLTNLVNGSPAVSFLGTISGTAVGIYLISIYYKKRSALFVN